MVEEDRRAMKGSTSCRSSGGTDSLQIKEARGAEKGSREFVELRTYVVGHVSSGAQYFCRGARGFAMGGGYGVGV